MTLTLILTRHAKSSWGDPGLPDHARPLNKRGRASAEAMGIWLKKRELLPDQVLSSSSQRTRETYQRMALTARSTTFTDDLYHASAQQILNELNHATGQTVLLLGHNPGIAEFAGQIVQAPPDAERFHDYPTCATTVITFDAPTWDEVDWHSGLVQDFILPRQLLD